MPAPAAMLAALESRILRARRNRWPNLGVVNLRILLGFALVPSGLKKVIDQPFTDPANTGAFHEFLHGFYATGHFYHFVGACQLLAALLLFSQRFATVGAMMLAPIFSTITVFCWSTGAYPTAVAVTLMLLGTAGLLLWDLQKWRGVLVADERGAEVTISKIPPVIDLGLWRNCGIAILVFYGAVSAAAGEIYRPRGLEFGTPAFWVLPTLVLFPVVTFFIDQARYRRALSGR